MAIEKVTMMVCDNPSCGEYFRHSKEEPAPGYHLGKGYWVWGGGGPIPSVYAHSSECIVPAIEAAIERAR
jgi:hypothetical protein